MLREQVVYNEERKKRVYEETKPRMALAQSLKSTV